MNQMILSKTQPMDIYCVFNEFHHSVRDIKCYTSRRRTVKESECRVGGAGLQRWSLLMKLKNEWELTNGTCSILFGVCPIIYTVYSCCPVSKGYFGICVLREGRWWVDSASFMESRALWFNRVFLPFVHNFLIMKFL